MDVQNTRIRLSYKIALKFGKEDLKMERATHNKIEILLVGRYFLIGASEMVLVNS